jgi:hypothetical protein
MTSRHARVTLLAAAAFTFAACSSTGAGASSAPTQPLGAAQPPVVLQPSAVTATPTPEPTASPSASPSDATDAGSAAPAGVIDPCTLLTSDEASTLMGMKLGAGVSTALDPDRVCTFKKGLTEVKLILAPPAPDAATADTYWDAERSQVPANLPVKDLKLFDRSAFGAGSAGGLSLSALFAIKGKYFFDLYCGLPGCSEDASVTAAQLIGGRLP